MFSARATPTILKQILQFLFIVHALVCTCVCMHVCVPMCCIGVVYVQVCMHVCLLAQMHTFGGQRKTLGILYHFSLIPLIMQFFIEPGARLAVSKPQYPCLHPLTPAPAGWLSVPMCPHLTFYVEAVDLNQDLHVCTSALTHQAIFPDPITCSSCIF